MVTRGMAAFLSAYLYVITKVRKPAARAVRT